jgi:large repetitive protein
MKKITFMFFMLLVTLCGFSQGLPLEDFEDNGNLLPTGWQQLDIAGNAQTWVVAPHMIPQTPSYGGAGHAAYINRQNVSTGTTEDWLVTPQFIGPANGQLRFMSRLTILGDNLSTYRIMMRIGGDPTDPAGYTEVIAWTELALNPDPFQTEYLLKVVPLPASAAGQSIYLAFVMNGDNGDRWLVDDVAVAPECLTPVGLATTNIGTNTATLNWTNPSGATSWNVDIVSAVGAPTGVGLPYNGLPPYVATTDSAGNPLQPATQYKYYVQGICTGNVPSNWAGPYFFTTVVPGTNCTAPLVIPTDTFSQTSNTNLYGDDIEGTVGAAAGCSTAANFLNGDEVVYAYTPTYTGTAGFSMTNNGANSGMFIYTSCANIGVTCATGGTGNATTPVNITLPVTAGTTYYVVISTSGTTQSTPYTLTIQQVNCAPPVGLPTTGVGPNSADLSWTNPTGATAWQVVTQPAGTGIPAGAGTAANTNTNWQATGLLEATNYEYYVRADCGDGTWSQWAGPYTFSTTQTPAPMNYSQNFDGATHGWALNNGNQPNKWVVGTSTFNSPGKSLYISDDNTAYNYNINSQSTVQAYRDIQLPATTDQVSLSFDWKSVGENCCDFLRVWVVPATFTPVPGTQITAAADRIQLGGNMNAQANWQTANFTLNAAPFAGTVRRLVFEWRNDGSIGPNPPAAVDNINVTLITCSTPSALVIGTLSDTSVTFNWTAPASGTPTYDYYFGTSSTPPTAGSTPTGNVSTNTVTIGSLTPSTTYYFWVRANCGDPNGNSFWVGPASFTTTQIPAPMDFTENFDGALSEWTLVNGTQTNKWVIGESTFNSPGKSLYITDNGTAYNYNINAQSTVQAYRDIQMPAALDQMTLSFTWKGVAENCCDFIKVWVVPTTFTPTAGTLITAAADRIQVGGNLNGQANWTNANFTINGAAWAGTTRRLVFEWRNDNSIGPNPPGAIDNVSLQVLTCPAPTALVIGALTENSATINWTGPTSVTPTFDYVFGTTNTAPVPATVPTGNVTPATASFTGLTPSTTYYFWVRSNCGTGNTSVWTGPLSFTTPQIPAPMDFTENFDAPTSEWTLVNGTQPNQWVIGDATFNSPGKSLYITDNGTAYNYNINAQSTVQAYRDIQMPAALDQLSLSFDWKALGENCCDFVRVWIVPITFTPTAGTQITAAADRIQVGGNHNGQANWQTANYTINGAAFAGSIRRLVFEWRNDNSIGPNPPGAIDNVNLQVITCPAPTALALGALTENSATINWTGPTSVTPTFDYVFGTTNTPPTDATVPTGNVTPATVTLGSLTPSTTYFYWVRSNCGAGDTSVWVGPLSFVTPQIPAPMDFTDSFDATTISPWTFVNGTQPNQWVIGEATFNSPGKSLYITDNGTNYNYNINAQSTVHAYRDIQMPATLDQLTLSFDWKALGENCCDFVRVWIVPVTFAPTAGTQITAAADRIQVGGNHNGQANWQTANYTINGAAFAGSIRRLVFEWRNDNSIGPNPPGAIDNVNFQVLTCPSPTALTLGTVTTTTANISWTAPTSIVPASYDYYLSTSNTSPLEGTVPTGNVTTTSVNLTPLIPNTTYYFWVRSNCGAGDTSIWLGPLSFITPQIPAELDYVHDFEETDDQWTLSNGTQTNKWIVGESTFNSPTHALYISNDGSAYNYNVNAQSNVFAYRDIAIPAGFTNDIDISFDWKGVGEGCCDFLRVWLVPTSFVPTPGVQITAAATGGGIQLGGDMNGQSNWTNTSFTVNGPSIAGTTRRVIFEWRNNGFTGPNPPAAIDNLDISEILCPKPINLVAAPVGTTQATFTWTPVGPATAWEVYIVPNGSPAPTAATVGLPASAPTLTVTTGLIPGTEYVVYVRSLCGGANGNSKWTGPVPFVMLPLCLPPDNLLVECISSTGASFTWEAGGTETSWEYALLPATAPFPTEGTVTTTPSFIATGLTVNTEYRFYVRAICPGGGYSTWTQENFVTPETSIVDAEPFCGSTGDASIIFNNTSGVGITEQIPGQIACLGSAPNPVWYYLEVEEDGQLDFQLIQNTQFDANGNPTGQGLDVDFVAFGPFGSLTQACAEIVNGDCPTCPNNTANPNFYPFGNIVDCSFDAAFIENFTVPNAQQGEIYAVLITNFNGAAGQIKLQQLESSTGSTNCDILYDVALGDDKVLCGVTDTTITATVTTPGNSETPTYEWFMDNSTTPFTPTVVSTTPLTQTILITEPGYHTYTVVVDVENAANTDPITDTVIVALGPEVNVPDPAEVVLCGDEGETTIDLTTLNDDILGALLPTEYEVSYYLTEAGATNGTDPIDTTVPFETATQVIYIRVNSIEVDTCFDVVPLTITVNETAEATINYADSPYCTNGGTAAVTHTGDTGGTYSSTAGLVIDAATGAITLASSTAGTYTVTYTIAAADTCPEFIATATVVVEAAPEATIAYDGTPFCAGAGVAAVTHTGNTGGAYSSTTGLVIDAATGEIDLAASTAGTYTVTYTVAATAACDALSVTTEVVLNTQFTATIAYGGTPYCTNGGTAAVTHTGDTGGTYSSTAGLVIDAVTGAITLASSTAGTYTVTYTIAATVSCPEFTTTATVVVEAAPEATIAYDGTPFCAGAGVAAVTQTGNAGGAYSSTTGLVIDAATGEIDLATSTVGTYTVTYTVAATAACDAISVTTEVVLNTQFTATIGYGGTPYCTNGGTAAVTHTGDTGGTYSSATGLVIDAATGAITLASSSAGTYTVTYTIAATVSCPEFTTTATVVVEAAPEATIAYAGTPYCSNGATAAVSQTGTTGGTYSSDAGLAIDPATGEINLANSTVGTYTVTYTVAATTACGGISVTTEVVISPLPVAAIAYGGSPYCSDGGIATVTQTGNAGGVYASGAGLVINTVTGDIDLAASTAGTYNVTYTIAAANGCPDVVATASVTVTKLPSAVFTYEVVAVCQNAGGNESATLDTGAVAGTFTTDVAGLAIDPATGVITPSASTEGTYIVTNTVAAANGCGAVAHSVTITINPAPLAGFSYDAVAYCQDSTNPSPILVGEAGTFSAPAGLVINSATGVIDLAATAPGTYTVTNTIAGTVDCPSVSASVDVTITSIPVVAVLQGCEGGSYMLEVTFDGDEIYTVDNVDFVWTNSAGTQIGTEYKIQVTDPDTYSLTVIPMDNNECSLTTTVLVEDTACDIPRGISPNNDGLNDNFDLAALDVKKLSIFNRYGQEVYNHGNGYTDQWGGQTNGGDELPTGTYFYMVERNNGESKTGWVYINREE